MAKQTKPLLNEGTVRRMMKLANMEALGNGFISEKYAPLEEEAEELEEHGKNLNEEPEDELDAELAATEDELGAEDDVADELGAELGAEEEGEVTITDEEAQCVIDLADRLKDAVGEEEAPEEAPEEMDFEAEEEVSLEEPASRSQYEEGLDEDQPLYEAALKSLDITLVDNNKLQKQAAIKEVKNRIYKRVINRLLKETATTAKPAKKSKK